MTRTCRRVTIRSLIGDATFVAILRPGTKNVDGYWEVYVEGVHIGSVREYVGTLDRKVGRLRHPGRRRTLWSASAPRTTADPYPTIWHNRVSRAAAIRELVEIAERSATADNTDPNPGIDETARDHDADALADLGDVGDLRWDV